MAEGSLLSSHVSDLIAVAHPRQAAATLARDNFAEGVRKGLVDVEDMIVIAYDEAPRLESVQIPLLTDRDDRGGL